MILEENQSLPDCSNLEMSDITLDERKTGIIGCSVFRRMLMRREPDEFFRWID